MGVSSLRTARHLGSARNIGYACLAAGFVLIVAGWYGAARLDHTQGQVPYLISGGIGGLALVVAGAALMLVDERRRQTRILLDRIERRTTEHRTPSPSDVVLGTTVYHRADCRLVAGRSLPPAARDQAAARDLEPCRICHRDEQAA